jgi:two-component system, OmpR family, sensor histidine kinase KdpD
MDSELRRDPERLLERIEEEERRKKRGRLKIFLGYASGVGKSVKMLAEGLRRRERGEDVVIGAIQPKSSPEIDRLVAQHEVIPTLKIGYRDVIDVERLFRRHPQVVVIDGLA